MSKQAADESWVSWVVQTIVSRPPTLRLSHLFLWIPILTETPVRVIVCSLAEGKSGPVLEPTAARRVVRVIVPQQRSRVRRPLSDRSCSWHPTGPSPLWASPGRRACPPPRAGRQAKITCTREAHPCLCRG